MAGFLNRLGRLAKAELNAFTERFRPGDDDSGVADADEELAADLEGDRHTEHTGAWPREIRRAYAALEVPLGSDAETVRAAHRKMLKRYHPDRHHGDDAKEDVANELTRRLGEARDRIVVFLEARG